MTTIAANLEEIAADGMMRTGDRIVNLNEPKLWRSGKSVFGFAGYAESWVLFREWQGTNKPRPELSGEGFGVLELAPDGLFLWFDKLVRVPVFSCHCAIGSGADFAVAAFEMGATPKEAVELAAKLDVGTGGKIQVERLRTAKKLDIIASKGV